MPEQQKSSAIQTALIGLVGTLLTVCGGLAGALITSAVTVYQVERKSQQVALAAPSGGKTLNVDISTILIPRQEAAALDPNIYYVNLEQGFVLHRPLPGWEALEEMTVEEQLAENNVSCQAVCDQPVFRIRYGEPIEIESDRGATVNGTPIPEELLDLSEMLYGPPPWKLPYYSEMILNVFDKEAMQGLGIDNLPGMILLMTRTSAQRVNRMVALEDSHFALVQVSSTYGGIRMAGEPATVTIDDWMLFAENGRAFYTMEITYTPQSGQPLQVWDDLQTYIDHFRAIE